jgi:CHAT domain-containing protein
MSGPGEIALQKQIKFIKGNSLRLLGRFNEALTSLQEWLQLNGQLPQPEPEGRIRRALGTLYREMSDVDNADLMYSEALRVARASGDAESEAGALLGLAATQKDRNRNQESIPLHLQALAVAERANLTRLRGEILNSLADGYSYIGQLDAASKYFQPALEIARSIGYRGLEAQVTERLGRVEMLRGHYAEAADLLTRADELEQTIPTQPDKAWTIKERLAKAERALGRQDQALTHFREAILLIEQMERSTVPSEMERALAVSVRREGFEEMVDFLVDMHRPGEALEIAERARARAFLEALNESQIDSQGELSAEQRSQEMELNRRVAANRHNAQGLSRAVNDLDAFYLELRRSNPAYAQLRRPELATLDRIQSELAGPDTALLEYMLGDNRSYAWAVTRDKIQLAVLPARKEIEALVNGYRDGMTAEATALTVRSTEREQRDRSRKLYRMLIQPLGEAVNSPGHLLIVPDGVLAYLPFESLVSSGKGEPYLLESHSTSYSESASASLALRSRFASGPGATKTLLAFADPDYGKAGQGTERGGVTWTSIPHTRDEVVGIARLYPAGDRVLRLGAEARESIVKSEDLRQYRYLHFAVHGFADEAHPERSGLVLSQDKDPDQDGILRMDEIARLRLDAELVTLSACQTAVGKLLDGEGLMTLSRTFFYAGARHVIATLWDVNDASTAELMKTLYASLKAGASPAGALREAKLRMLHGKEGLWRDPHFWSAFVAFQ